MVNSAGVVSSIGGGGTLDLTVAREYTAQQGFNATTTTTNGAIAWDLNTNQVREITLNGNATISNPTNIQNGTTYILTFIQDATGSRLVTAWGNLFRFPNAVSPTLSTAVGAIDIITFVAVNGLMCGVASNNFQAV